MEGLFFGFAVELSDKVSGNATRMRKEVDLLRTSIERIGGASSKGLKARPFLAYARGAKRAGSATAKTGGIIGRFGAAAKRMAGKVAAASGKLSFMQKVMLGLGATFGARAIFRGLRSLGGAFVDAVKVGSEFGKTMQFAGAVAGATAPQLAMMRNEAKRLGATTAFTASQAAEGFVVLAQAGVNATDSISILGPSLNLAGAGMIDLEKATQFTVDQIRSFSLESKDAERVTDILSAGFTSASMSAGQLQLALKQAGPVANAAGRSLEETVATLGVFANAGFRGASGGVALRNMLAEIQTPSAKLTRAMDHLGIKMSDLDPKTHSLSQIMKTLGPLANDAGLTFGLFGKRTAPAFIAAVNQGSDAVDAMMEKMGMAKSAAELYIAQLDNVAGAMKIVESATEAVKIELFDVIKDQLKNELTGFATLMQKAAVVVRNLAPAIREVFNIVSSVVHLIFSRIAGSVGGLTDAMGVLAQSPEEAKEAIANVVGPLTLALTLIKFQILDFVDGFIDGMGLAFSAVGAILGPILDLLAPVIDWFAELFGITDEGSSKAKKLGKIMGVMFGAFLAFIAIKAALIIPMFVIGSLIRYATVGVGAFKLLYKGALGLTKFLVNPRKGLAGATKHVRKAFAIMGKGIKLVYAGILRSGKILLRGMSFVGRNVGKIFARISKFGVARMATLAGAFAIFGTIAYHTFKAVQDDSLNTMDKIEHVGKSSLSSILGFMAGLFGIEQEKVDIFVEWLSFKMGQGIDDVVSWVQHAASTTADFFLDMYEKAKGFMEKIGILFKGFWSAVAKEIKDAFDLKKHGKNAENFVKGKLGFDYEGSDPNSYGLQKASNESRRKAYEKMNRKLAADQAQGLRLEEKPKVFVAKAMRKEPEQNTFLKAMQDVEFDMSQVDVAQEKRAKEREEATARKRANHNIQRAIIEKEEMARIGAMENKRVDVKMERQAQKRKMAAELAAMEGESRTLGADPGLLSKSRKFAEKQFKGLGGGIADLAGFDTSEDDLFGPTSPMGGLDGLDSQGDGGLIDQYGGLDSGVPEIAQGAMRDLEKISDTSVEKAAASRGGPITMNFQAGSVVIQAAGGDPEVMARKFLPVMRRLIAEEERRGR